MQLELFNADLQIFWDEAALSTVCMGKAQGHWVLGNSKMTLLFLGFASLELYLAPLNGGLVQEYSREIVAPSQQLGRPRPRVCPMREVANGLCF